MNELVQRLSEGTHPVQANRPDQSALALRQRIEIKYVHILFRNTGTEIGVRLDEEKCNYASADFENGVGTVHFEGVLTLNGDKVRCIANIDLKSMEGTGHLELIDEADYNRIINTKENAY